MWEGMYKSVQVKCLHQLIFERCCAMISPYHSKLYKLSRRNNVKPSIGQLYSNYHQPSSYLLRTRDTTSYTNTDKSLIAKPDSSQSDVAFHQIDNIVKVSPIQVLYLH